MNVDEIYQRFTSGNRKDAVRAGWLGQYLESPISFWCDLHAPESAKEPISDQQQYIFDVGKAHQERVNEQMYPGGVEERHFDDRIGFRRALEVMSGGSAYLKDMPLLCWSHGLTGRPDVLEKVDGVPSVFGDHSYRVIEVKSSRKLRESQILQAALYNRVLGMVQEFEPPEFYLVNRDMDLVPMAMEDYNARLDEVLAQVREVMAGKKVASVHGAGKWPWTSYIDGLAVEANDVSLLTGVGQATRDSLVAAGFQTLEAIAKANETELVAVNRVGPTTARKMMVSAQAIQEKRPVRRGQLGDIRRGKTEVFFDFEGAQEGDQAEVLEMVNYLIGAVYRVDGGEAKYIPFFAESFDEEDGNLRNFLEWGNSLDDAVFYHWHHYERTHLNKMVDRYGVDANLAAGVLERMEDLSPWVNKAYAFPAYGEGLKAIAKSLGFHWQQDGVSGVGSMTLYVKYVESGSTDEEAKQKIVLYNEDDCFATMHIYDWVMAQEI